MASKEIEHIKEPTRLKKEAMRMLFKMKEEDTIVKVIGTYWEFH